MQRAPLMNENIAEQELISACREGDNDAFEVLFRQNQKRVFSVALNFFGGNSEMAEDVTQQVFLKLFTALVKFRGDAKVSTWLYRITVNICIDEQKKRRRYAFLSDLIEPRSTHSKKVQEKRMDRFEIEDEVRSALGSLKVKFRMPIVLKYVEGLSYSEIAEVMDCSEGTVASRLSRGHKMLARKLGHLRDSVH